MQMRLDLFFVNQNNERIADYDMYIMHVPIIISIITNTIQERHLWDCILCVLHVCLCTLVCSLWVVSVQLCMDWLTNYKCGHFWLWRPKR